MPKPNTNYSGLLDTWGRRNRKIQDKECENCGKIFRPVDSKKRTCSKKCGYAIRANGAIKLRKTEVWWKNPKGYIEGRIWIDEHTQIRVKQHRYFMEIHIGRKLFPNEDVHHKNGIKTDNRITNLQIIDHGEHTKITNKRPYKKGYKLKLTNEERTKRAERFNINKKIALEKRMQSKINP